MRTRTTISLDRPQLGALKARARAEGISVAEFVRRVIDDYLRNDRPPACVPSSAFERMIALGSSGRADISDRHDERIARPSIRGRHASGADANRRG